MDFQLLNGLKKFLKLFNDVPLIGMTEETNRFTIISRRLNADIFFCIFDIIQSVSIIFSELLQNLFVDGRM